MTQTVYLRKATLASVSASSAVPLFKQFGTPWGSLKPYTLPTPHKSAHSIRFSQKTRLTYPLIIHGSSLSIITIAKTIDTLANITVVDYTILLV